MKEIKYKECYVVGDCLHIQFVDGESYNFLLDSVVEEMVGGLTSLALDAAKPCQYCKRVHDSSLACPEYAANTPRK